jgi:hypothetical protein
VEWLGAAAEVSRPGALLRRSGVHRVEVGVEAQRQLGDAEPPHRSERGREEHVGNREPVSHEVVVALERFLQDMGGLEQGIPGRLGALGVGLTRHSDQHQPRLDL